MHLPGWSETFEDFEEEIRFELAPLWLRTLSRTIYFERFAYPIALKKGLGLLWPRKDVCDFKAEVSPYWKVMTTQKSTEDRIFEGSLAVLTSRFLPKRRRINELVILLSRGRFEIAEGFALTRAGRLRAIRGEVHRENGTQRQYLKTLAQRKNLSF